MDAWQRLAEKRIVEAQRNGEFDNLPGKGKPLPPDPFASLPPEMRTAARVMRNAGLVPEEVVLLRAVNEARDRVANAKTPQQKALAMREYTDAELRCNVAMDRWRRMLGPR